MINLNYDLILNFFYFSFKRLINKNTLKKLKYFLFNLKVDFSFLHQY